MTTRTSILSLSLLLSTAACGEDGPAMSAGGTTGGGGDRGDGHADEDDDDAGHDTSDADDDADGDAGRDGGDMDDGGDGGDDGHLVDRGDHDGGADGGASGDGWGDGGDGGDAGDGWGDGGDGGDGGGGGDAGDGWGDSGDGGGSGDGGAASGDGWGDSADGGDAGDGGEDGESGGTCVPVEVPLVAGQTFAAGWVDISTVADGLRVEVQADAPWTLALVHVYVGLDLPPHNAGGLIPGQFPYQVLLDDASEYALVVPWDVVGGACGEKVNVAVHAEVVQTLDGVIVEEETAWAKGSESKGSDWSSWLDPMLCCD